VTILLVVLILAGLVLLGVRTMRSHANQASTRVIGPDDDPDFMWHLSHPDSPR